MDGAGRLSKLDEGLATAADRGVRREDPHGVGSGDGEPVSTAVRGTARGTGSGVRVSWRAATVSLVRAAARDAGLRGSGELAGAWGDDAGFVYPDSDVCVWRGADRGPMRDCVGVPAAAGVLRVAR